MSFFEWVLILSGAASLATLVAGALFFGLKGIFGPISDIASILLMLLLIVTAVHVYRVGEVGSFALALLALLVGLGGMTTILVLQTLLVLGVTGFRATFEAELAAGGAIGLWLIAGTVAIAMGTVVPSGLLYLAIGAGIAYALPLPAYRLGGAESPAFYGVSLLGVAGYAMWAFWLVRAI